VASGILPDGAGGIPAARKRPNDRTTRAESLTAGIRKFFPPGWEARRHTAAPPPHGHFDFGLQIENDWA